MKQILMFVLFATLLCWQMFSPMYKHVIIVRQALLQQEVDYLLEVGANATYGYIDAAMIAASKGRLADIGFETADLDYTVTTTSGIDGTNPLAPVRRGTGIRVSLSYPYGTMFAIDRLIGIVPPTETARMSAAGMKMSEYIPE
jgi:hypothetical protein